MPITAADITDRLERLTARINKACRNVERDPSEVSLVAVSKTISADVVRAGISAGLTVFGENYIQEAQAKINEIDSPAVWHFIGHLQSNKARFAVTLFDLIHSVDTVKLARELDKRAGAVGRRMPILVQVNISGEESKSGAARDQAEEFISQVLEFPNLATKGLMTMPPFFEDPDLARPYFKALRELKDKIGPPLTELSMGMSGDFEAAIEEGATLIRVGTAIFGPRA
jgi:pyridoxal phosphate enzyme (YggS family)